MAIIYDIVDHGYWLDGDKLWTCLALPPQASENDLVRDAGREEALSLARALLSEDETGWSRVHHVAGGNPVLVQFPELAFRTANYAQLDAMVRALTRPAIVLAGFGLATADALAALLGRPGVEAAWSPELFRQMDGGVCNGLWCWIHHPGASTRCVVALKCEPEQTFEKSLDFQRGVTFLRVATRDLTLFPVICFDLIQDVPGAFARRVSETIDNDNLRRVVVGALLYDTNPQHDGWSRSIGRLTDSEHSGRVVVLIANATVGGEPDPSEEIDRWRQRCGAFVASRATSAPRRPFPYVRFVERSPAEAGLVLRNPRPGAAVGPLAWTNSGDTARGVWVPNWHARWTGGRLEPVDGSATYAELERWARRWTLPGPEATAAAQAWTCERLGAVLAEAPAEELLESVLAGVDVGTKVAREAKLADPDLVPERSDHVRLGLSAFAAASGLPGARLVPAEGMDEGAQLEGYKLPLHVVAESPERRIVTWYSPELTDKGAHHRVSEHVVRGGSGLPLVAVVRGKPGGAVPPRGLVNAGVDVAAPSVERAIGRHRAAEAIGGIASARPAPVFWIPMGEVEGAIWNAESEDELVSSLVLALDPSSWSDDAI